MTSREIENKVIELVDNFNREEFIYDLLSAYGLAKSTITKLKKGNSNLSKIEGEVFLKRKVFFKHLENGLLDSIDNLSNNEKILNQKVRFLIVTDFKTLLAKDLKTMRALKASITDLPKHFGFFLPLAGSEKYNSKNDNKADRDAAYLLGKLFDILIEHNPEVFKTDKQAHNLNVFLSRLLFCFFAEDTDIFSNTEKGIFTNTLEQHTTNDGKDTHLFLDRLFKRLNIENSNDFPEHIAKFPYVNGGLFGAKILSPKFTKKAREILIECGDLDWSEINPDIFGSMIQAVVRNVDDDNTKHYTSVPNILKVIKPLFLDELYEEFEKSKESIPKLRKLIHRLANIKFFDPACGSGNFLIIAYKEVRSLEIEILKQIIELSPNPTLEFTQIQLNQFYGIELDDFAHEMAILSLWLAEHQMNIIFEEQLFDFGQSKPTLPLKEAGKIVRNNAARIDWKTVCPIDIASEVYILGNPPYEGARKQSASQKTDMSITFNGMKGYNNMDYIAPWFYKGAKYIEGFNSKCALVTTNSICQGEQVSLIWKYILSEQIEIDFAYQSFKWSNSAKGQAGVSVIIVGLRNTSNKPKQLYTEKLKKEAKNINAYLLDAQNIVIQPRTKPLSKFPEMSFGSMPNDGGFLSLDELEMNELISSFSESKKFIKNFMGGAEFVRGINRYCLWIDDKDLKEALKFKVIDHRVEQVKKHRENSKREATNKLADSPHLFGEIRHQNTDSIIIPATSSERREYIPMGFLNEDTVISNSAMAIYHAQPWLLAILTSKMHMVWVNAVGGKLKTDYRYSAKLCYNTFPFPDISVKDKELLNDYVFDVLDARANYPEKTLAWLYDPNTMPKVLKEAHHALDKAVEQCYTLREFRSDADRLEHLFKLYEEMLKKDTLFAKQKKTRKSKKK